MLGIKDEAERAAWSAGHRTDPKDVELSDDQVRCMQWLYKYTAIYYANLHAVVRMLLYIAGRPGSGKSEVIIQFAVYAAGIRLRVLILCTTGQLVHTYRIRLPGSPYIVIQTMHAGLAIRRDEEKLVEHCPPNALRHYDLIMLGEASQYSNAVGAKFVYALRELVQNPMQLRTLQ